MNFWASLSCSILLMLIGWAAHASTRIHELQAITGWIRQRGAAKEAFAPVRGETRAKEREQSRSSEVNLAEIESFWKRTLARAATEPLEAVEEQVTGVEGEFPYKKYRITYRSLDGVKIQAYLSKPYESVNYRLPAVITAPGYGGINQYVQLGESMRGYVILQVYPRSQGESAKFWKIKGDKLAWHIAQPEGYYYQGAYVDVLRGIDYLVSRSDVDAERIGAMGASQAGGIVLALAALDPRIKTVVANLPCLCDMERAAAMQGSLVNYSLGPPGLLTRESLRTLSYFDALNLAHRIQGPVLLSAAGKDASCPAETIKAVFDKLPGIKWLAFYPDLGHTSATDFYKLGWDWMERHLKP